MRFVLCILAACGWATAAMAADETRSLGEFGGWQAYTHGSGPAKVCYTTASAKLDKAVKDRTPTYLSITHRAKSRGEVSLTGPFKKEGQVELQIGAKKHALFTKGDAAWIKQSGGDKLVVAQLGKAKEAVVHITPSKGPVMTQVISLTGFGKALAAIDKACGVKK